MRTVKLLNYIFTMPALLIAFTAMAGTGNAKLDSANAAYSRSEYEKASKLYEEVLASGAEAPELYYNLGNCYYKLGKNGLSIVNYERALKLAPDDEDAKFNLAMANERITDKIKPVPQLFIEEWKSGFVNLFSATGWAIMCIVLFVVFLVMIALFITGRSKGLRQLGFWAGLTCLVTAVTAFFMAKTQYTTSMESQEAIVIAPAVTVKGSPNEKGTKLFVIHEGAKAQIEEIDGGWVEVKFADGKVGWVQASAIVFI